MFENARRGRQARNFTENDAKILDLKSSSEQIIFRILSLGAPGIGRSMNTNHMTTLRYFLVLHLICNARRSIIETKPIEQVSEIRVLMDIAMEKTTVGEENPYFEIETTSKQTDDAVIYDDVAPDEKKGPEKGGPPSTEPAQSCAQENFLKLQRMLHIVTAVAIISLLTAAASLALALIVMNSQNTKDSVRCPADCVKNAAVQGT